MTSRPACTSRRQFLRRTSGAVLALPTIITGNALGAPAKGIPPASERILIGAIGVGNQGRGNMRQHIQNIIAVCEVDSQRLAEAKATVEKATDRTCAAYGDYRKLLENKDVDAVIITTPDHWHALITIHACMAGKDVYCEKPLTLTIREGREMVKAARKYNRIVQTGSQQRSADNFRLACELVRSGRLGKIHTVRVGISGVNFSGPPVPDSDPPPELDYDMWLGPAPQRPYNKLRVHYNFRFFWDYSGGQMTNWGAHHLDIAQWGLDMDNSGPVSAEAKARFHKDNWYEVPQWCEVTYKYANGITMICGQSERGGTTFEGENGVIYVNRGRLESKPEAIIKEPLKEGDVRLYVSKNHHGNWLECIKTRKLPICDVEIGHRSATVCHLGNIAIRSGRKVTWDPAKEEIVGDSDHAKMVHYSYRAPWQLPAL
ncbi:MAG: Gfo/Idh/MocA family oxidoreductase [Candidatus Sumerlaeia bacterium]|nr:Gfo/Idh/MocA family oxidoreductase [Candidatus Sumerlaeia bacterium]